MCDCINKTLNGLKAMHPEASFVTMDLINIHSINEPTIRKTGQKFSVGFQKVNKKGIIIETKNNSFVTHNFCPWCGESYNKNKLTDA